MIEVRQTAEFSNWFKKLRDRQAKARIAIRIDRFEAGNFGDVKSVGGGVQEARLPYGPGYRLYFAYQGETMIMLLIGGDKTTQARDIKKAKDILNEL